MNKLSVGLLAVACLAWNSASAVKSDYRTRLNQALVGASKGEPGLFGSDPVCKRDNTFWRQVEKQDLLTVLENTTSVQEYQLDQKQTVWFFQVSTCFSGNQPAFQIVVRNGGDFTVVRDRVSGLIENVRLEGNKILFDLISYAGLSSEYHYVCSYDGKKLVQTLKKHIER